MGLLRFAIKCGIAGGAVYYTIEEGLWSSPEESGKFYNKLYNNIYPLIQQNISQDVIQEIHTLPNLSDFKVCVASHYNKYVKISVNFLSKLPTHVVNGVEWAKKEIEKNTLASNDTLTTGSKTSN